MNNQPNPHWIQAAASSEIETGESKECFIGEHIIAIFRTAEGLFALDGLCAHQGGPIAKGQVTLTDQKRPCVTCPWHGWQYELETGIQTVNRQPLQRTFPIRERDGHIEVAID